MFTFSTVLGGWTSVLLFTNTSYNSEIKEVIDKMYLNQKNFVVNVMDLSILLVKDANKRFSEDQRDYNNANQISNNF